VAVADPRDEFPNNFVGDLMPADKGWVVVPPTSCPDGHSYTDPGWSVSSVWCTCNGRHMMWRCWNWAELCCTPLYFICAGSNPAGGTRSYAPSTADSGAL
jgi:hypothetical protein